MIDVNNILFVPRTGDEVEHATHGNVPIYLYSELCKKMKESHGHPERVIQDMLKHSLKNFILIQNPRKMNSGHWTSLSANPHKREIYFFSSYGGRPDEEKNQWISPQGRVLSGQDANLLNDGLKKLMTQQGWTIHYNQYPYQRKGDKTATCGIWTAAFLNSNLNPDDFFQHCAKYNINVIDLYKKYFL